NLPGNASHPVIKDSLMFCKYSKYLYISADVNVSFSESDLTEGLLLRNSRSFTSKSL
ncbi:3574_t:CDS:1, partial [Racocetra fulgida]